MESSLEFERIEEREEFRSLNSRLEQYVANQRALRAEVAQKDSEIAALGVEYESRVTSLERQFAIELNKLKQELAAANKKDTATIGSIAALQADLAAAKAQLVDVKALQSERNHLRDALERAEADGKGHRDARLTLEIALKKLKDELAAANKLNSELRGVLADRNALIASLKSELAQLLSQRDQELENAKKFAAAKVAEARAMWEQHGAQKLKELEESLKAAHEADTKDLRARDREQAATAARLRKEVAKLGADLETQTTLSNGLIARIATLEEESKTKAVIHQREKAGLEGALSGALEDKAAKVKEFNALMDVKVSLDAELDHYHRLLEAEEKNAGLPPSPKGGKKTPPASTGKRRAEAPPAAAAAASAAPTSTAGRKKRRDAAGVKIALDLVEERVDVHNSTDRTLSLAGWKLKSIEGSQEFAFPEGFELAAGATVVVWSGPDSKKHHNPPTDLSWTRAYVWNNKGDTAVLVNPDGEEVSTVVGVVHDSQEVSASEAVAAAEPPAAAAEVTAAEKPAGCVQM